MFTCDEEIGADATDLFNYLTGYSAKKDYRKLLVAPINLRPRMEELIEREIAHQQKREARSPDLQNEFTGRSTHDPQALPGFAGWGKDRSDGARMCCLRPGVPGVSENIRVISVVGRFLEHSRIYYFRNGGERGDLLGSADLMPRNINRRVEVLFPIKEPWMVNHIRDEILAVYLRDNVKARRMLSNSTYEHLYPNNDKPLNSQAWFLEQREREIALACLPSTDRQSGKSKLSVTERNHGDHRTHT